MDISKPEKRFIEQQPTKEEVGTIKLITMKKQISRTAMENRNFPDGVDQGIMTAYYKAAMDNFAEAQELENCWWEEMLKKYDLVAGVKLDLETRRFYYLD